MGVFPGHPLGQFGGQRLQPLARALRVGTPSVFARVWRGQLQLDVLALQRGDDERLVQALSALPAGEARA